MDFFNPVKLRSDLQTSLLNYVDNFKSDGKKMSVFICGLPGSGKTFTIKNTFFHSTENDGKKWNFVNPNVFYFNCCVKGNFLSKLSTELNTWANYHSKKIIKTRKKKRSLTRQPNKNSSHFLANIKKALDGKVLILDEIDTINPNILYSFLEIENLLVFCIANKMVYENRIRSRISAVIGVECYTSGNLKEILSNSENKNEIKDEEEKSKTVDEEKDVKHEVLKELISKKVSVVNGDARKIVRVKDSINEAENKEEFENIIGIHETEQFYRKSVQFVDKMLTLDDFHFIFWKNFSEDKKQLIKQQLGVESFETPKKKNNFFENFNLIRELDQNGIDLKDCPYLPEDIQKYEKMCGKCKK